MEANEIRTETRSKLGHPHQMRLTHVPSGKQVSGEGPSAVALKVELLAQLEKIVPIVPEDE